MNCAELAARIADYLGDELPATERAAAEAHPAGCAACRAEVEADRQTLAALNRLAPPPAEVAARATRGLTVVRRQPAVIRWGWAALRSAAVLAMGMLLGRAVRPSAPIEPPTQQPSVLHGPQLASSDTDSPIHPRWIALARQCERGGGSELACQLAVLAETAR
jgi:anti-sigma factor RsiW